MTADYVALHAAERPGAVAVIHDGRVITFAELSADIRRIAHALGALGLARGTTAAIGTGNVYLNWLLLLACERLGIGAASFQSHERDGCTPLMSAVDLVLAEPGFACPGARRLHQITPEWLGATLDRSAPAPELTVSKAPEDPVRLLRTSGTTRVPRQVLVRRRMHDTLLTQGIAHFGLSERCRFLQSLPLVVRTAYDFGSACLRMGGTLLLESRMPATEAIVAHRPTHAIILPMHLKNVLDSLPVDFPKPQELTILSLGAGVPSLLRKTAMARLATGLCELYGTVEAGAISSAWSEDEEGLGCLWPGVEVEVVDEQDRPLPPGSVGSVRVRAEWICARYEDDPEATRRAFRSGWFYPGDAGSLRADGKIKVLGRTDDLLNISGNKLHPADIESLLLRQGIAGDVGVGSVTDTDGIEVLGIAISDLRLDDGVVMGRITHALRQTPGRSLLRRQARAHSKNRQRQAATPGPARGARGADARAIVRKRHRPRGAASRAV